MYSASAKSILKRKRERAPKGAGNARRARHARMARRRVHRARVYLSRAGFGDQRRRFVAERARIFLTEFLAAAVALHVAVSADIDDEVVSVEAAAEAAQDFIAAVRDWSATSMTSRGAVRSSRTPFHRARGRSDR